jgi:hypothetical protein
MGLLRASVLEAGLQGRKKGNDKENKIMIVISRMKSEEGWRVEGN